MSDWKPLEWRRREETAKAISLYRRVGYSDGYALLPAKSLHEAYQVAWRRGREARRLFDAGNAE